MNDITALMATMKAAAEKATPGEWSVQFGDEVYATDGVENEQIAIATNDARDADFIALANPANVRALVEALEARDKQIAKYHTALNSLAFVARRYLPDYDEHPEIQAADELLDSAAGIQVIEGEGR